MDEIAQLLTDNKAVLPLNATLIGAVLWIIRKIISEQRSALADIVEKNTAIVKTLARIDANQDRQSERLAIIVKMLSDVAPKDVQLNHANEHIFESLSTIAGHIKELRLSVGKILDKNP